MRGLTQRKPRSERTYLEIIRPVKLRLQLAYVRQKSFGTDLSILLHTAIAIVRGQGGLSASTGR